MQVSNLKKFLDATEAAGIKEYVLITDTAPTHYYNNDTKFNIYDMDEEIVYNFGAPVGATPVAEKHIQVNGSDFGDIHEVRFWASLDEVKKFIESYGMPITDEQMKILVNINGANYRLMPQTGDYTFIPKSESEIEKMTDKEKEEYEKLLKTWQESNKQLSPVMVTI